MPHSCGNRHCPSCQKLNGAQWLEQQVEDLLPIPYFHVVFTLPHDLNGLIQYNQRWLYSLLFSSASATLLEFGRNNLKATLGITAVLHTWSQSLLDHYHLHCVVTGGGLSLDGKSWVSVDPQWLFSVQALSVVFRAKFRDGLRQLFDQGQLDFPSSQAQLSDPVVFERWLHEHHRPRRGVSCHPDELADDGLDFHPLFSPKKSGFCGNWRQTLLGMPAKLCFHYAWLRQEPGSGVPERRWRKMRATTMIQSCGWAMLLWTVLAPPALAQSQLPARQERKTMSIRLVSSAFAEGQPIPAKYTCDGKDVSPPLAWSEVPPGTKSFALIADDPDAPVGTWVHWVLYDLPANTADLPEAVPGKETLPTGAKQGKNDFRKTGYGGPCPPPGKPHRYFFKLYALDARVGLKPGASKQDLLRAMASHILAEGQLMGIYQRK